MTREEKASELVNLILKHSDDKEFITDLVTRQLRIAEVMAWAAGAASSGDLNHDLAKLKY